MLINGAAPLTGSVTASQIDAEASTDGYVLTSDGAGNAAWEAVAGGGTSTLYGLSDVSLPAPPGAHRYWRINVTATPFGGWVIVDEMELRSAVSGADQTGSGTATASTTNGSDTADKAFDDLPTTSFSYWRSLNTSFPEWLQYDFGAGNEIQIVEYTIRAATSSQTRAPSSFTFEYSDDGTNWTVVDTQSGLSWASDETKTFAVATGPSDNDLLQYNSTGGYWENVVYNPIIPGLVFTDTPESSPSGTTNGASAGFNILIGDGFDIGTQADNICILKTPTINFSDFETQNAVLIGKSLTIDRATDGVGIGRSVTIGGSSSTTYPVSIGAFSTCQVSNSVSLGPFVNNSVENSFRAGYSNVNTLHLKDLGRLHLEGTQAGYVAPSFASGAEPTAVAGQIIYDSTNNKLKFYNGTAWETITSA